MRLPSLSLLKRLGALWLAGGAILAVATWVCYALDLDPGVTAFVYVTIIVGLSLWDSFLSSALFSLAAVLALNYFFVDPKFSFDIQYQTNIPLLGVFLLTSFVVTSLVRRLQRSSTEMGRQAQLLDLTHDTVVARNDADVITFWNRGAERLYGWSREEAVGKVLHELLRTEFPTPREAIEETLRRSGYWEGELINANRRGHKVIVASRWSIQRDDRGRPIGTLETNNDITERKRAEEALRRSQAAYLAEAQKLSLTGSFGWDSAGNNTFWSDQAYTVLGYEPAVRPSVAAMLARVHPEDAVAVQQAIDGVPQHAGELDLEFRLLLPDGTVKYVHAVGHAMAGDLDRTQFVGALMDITATKRAELRLHQAQAQAAHVARVTSLGALTASIAHEVNQPLAAIVSHGEASLRWLNRREPRLDEVDASIRHVIANGKRASEVVQRIRGLIGKTDTQQSQLSVNDLIEEIVPLVRHEVARHRAILRLELAPNLPTIQGDRIQLQQVIINLVINAVQAMATIEDRPRVVVAASRAEGEEHVVLEVQDSGPGIDPERAAQLFEPFFTTKPGGMGIGLSICRSIIESHGGQISVRSRVPEPGAVFRCCLPRRHEE